MQPLNINLGPFQCKASCVLTLFRELGYDWRLLFPRLWDFQLQTEGPAAYLAGSAVPRQLMARGEELFGCSFREHGGSEWERTVPGDTGWRLLTTDMYHLEFSRHYQTSHYIHFVLLQLQGVEQGVADFYDPLLDEHKTLELEKIRQAFVMVAEDQLDDDSIQYGSFYTVTAPPVAGLGEAETNDLLRQDLVRMRDHYRDVASHTLEGLATWAAGMSGEQFADGPADWLLERIAHLPTARAFFGNLFTLTAVVPNEHHQGLTAELTEIVQSWWRSMYLLSRFVSAKRDRDREALVQNLLATAGKERQYVERLVDTLPM